MISIAALASAALVALNAESHGVTDTIAASLGAASFRPSVARLSVIAPYRPAQHVFVIRDTKKLEAYIREHLPNGLDRSHALGVTLLFRGDAAGAVRELARAAELAQSKPVGPERRAAVLNDFAVAHTEHARQNPKSLVIGLDAAEKAWALDRTPATAWTRAVLLSTLASNEVGARAWDDYLAVEHTSLRTLEALRERNRLRGRPSPRLEGSSGIPVARLPPGSFAIERYDRAFQDFLRVKNYDGAAAVLLARAETLQAMRATDEAWQDLVKARTLVSRRTPVTEEVIAALGLAAARHGYLHAARALLLDAIPDAHAEVRACLAPWQAFVKACIARGVGRAQFHRLRLPTCAPRSGFVGADARFVSTNRNEVALSMDFFAILPAVQKTPDGQFVPAKALREESLQALFEHQARLDIAHGSLTSALWMSDRARAPFGTWSSCGESLDASLDKKGRHLARCVPNGVTLVHQDLDEENLHTWVIRDGTIKFTVMTVSAPRLRAEIEEFVSDVSTGRNKERLRQQAMHLYDILLKPVEQQIAGADVLVYSPSANLRDVPFSALHDGQGFLVERRRVMITRRISEFELPPPTAPTASALVVLPSAAAGVTQLRGARREVRRVTEIYDARGTLLADEAATPELFLGRAEEYDIVHVATHGDTSGFPYRNTIDFGARRIRAYDIMRLRFDRAPVVMLAACRTATDGDGPANLSMAKAFLLAGASAVIGSLWDVDDDSTAELSIAFHRELARGAAPHDALRHAQLELIRRGRPMSAWAAFQISS